MTGRLTAGRPPAGRPPAGRAVVVGSVGLDLVADSPSAASADAAAGNTGANIAIRLAAAGWQVTFVTVVGDDAAGALVRADCERWGVGTAGFTVDRDYPTPRVFAVSDGSGPAELLFRCPGCGAERGRPLRIPRLDQLSAPVLAAAAAADLVLADIPGPAAAALAAAARGGLTWYEASLYEAAPAEQQQLAALADVLKCSREELVHYAGIFATPAPRTRVTIVTAGPDGTDAELRDGVGLPQRGLHVAAAPAVVVDPLGAGDAFTAAVAAALADAHRIRAGSGPAAGSGSGSSLARLDAALRAGAAAAARAVAAVGARGDMTAASMTTAAPAAIVSPWIARDVPFRCPQCAP